MMAFRLSSRLGLWPLGLLLLAAPLALWPELNRALFLSLHQAARLLPSELWRLFSVCGDWASVLALMLAAGWRRSEKLPGMLAGAALAIALAILLKAGFAVPRPPLVLPPGSVALLDKLPGNGSFPSGHAMAAACLATFLYYGCGWRRAGWLALGAALVMLSRIAIGVHWPLDLAAGAWLGWASMRLALRWAWPAGWPGDITRTVRLILLVALSCALAWQLGHPGAYEEYWLRVGVAGVVIAYGLFQLRKHE